MLKRFKADLHIHTCLSPCTEQDMSPVAIAQQAKIKEIDIIGICDHNSAENVPALINAAKKNKITVLPGIEVTSNEEVHILALFDEIEPALKLQEIIYKNLPGENDEEAFGMQVVVNEKGEVLHFNEKLLIGASTLSIKEVAKKIHELEGLSIAAHIDREGFSLIGQLGFIPPDLELDALEISPAIQYEEAIKKFNPSLPLTCSSDAHCPKDIGKCFSSFLLKAETVTEIKKALKNEEGRKIFH
ncbi:MAG: PHP domain-containing protein [Candidatus Aminicenantaceae bacterium]